MRKIIAGIFMSLDGVVESEDKWTRAFHSQELGNTVGGLMAGGDAMLLGRLTYQFFEEQFAGQSGGEADMMNNTPKVVVSSTLTSADWNNSTLISENAAEEITKLKQQPGKALMVSGSGTLVRWLLREGLLDELHLLVFPIAVGTGKHLFDNLDDEVTLKLSSSSTLPNGVLHLSYQPA
jgi:dihydrofolate reductase